MPKQIVRTDTAPPPIGPYSQAVQAGNLIFVAGQGCMNPSSGQMERDSIASETRQVLENVKVIPDGSGEFTRKMGMLVAKDNLGFGMRSWRYAAIINDGVVEQLNIEAPGEYSASSAETMLGQL